MSGVKLSKRVWLFRRDGCCGGEGRKCDGRTLVVTSSPVTFDRANGFQPRRMEVECLKCGKPYTLFSHTGRVEVRNP